MNTKDKHKAIAFCRVFQKSDINYQKAEIDLQLKKIKELAKKKDMEIVKTFYFVGSLLAPKGQNGKVLSDLHKYLIKRPDVRYILISDVTRLTRSLEVYNYFCELLAPHNVTIVAASGKGISNIKGDKK